MKKSLALILSALLLASSFAGCDDGNKPTDGTGAAGTTTAATTEDPAEAERLAKYEAAVAALADDELTEDGTYTMSEDLITALENAEFTEAKNIIFMIGDGMGFNQLEGAEAYYTDSLYEGKMAWRYLPMVSSQSSSSADATVTDSAAGGTALSTGFRTSNSTLAMDVNDAESYKTVLELAAEKGKSTGIIATKDITDATPASYSSHVGDRGENLEIAVQQINKMVAGELDLMMGGGAQYFDHNRQEDLLKKIADNGINYTSVWDEAVAAELPMVGLWCDDHLDTFNADMPTLAEMTDLALDNLGKDENGFFLMVEGSQIDTYGHSSMMVEQFHETYQFDCAIAVALRFAAMNPDTVIIITADHETGGVILPANPTKDTVADEAYFTSNGAHSEVNVPVLAIGHGVEALEGINHNTDCGIFVASLLGEENFGQAKTVHTFLDTDLEENVTAVVDANGGMAAAVEGGIAVTFDGDNGVLQIPVDALDISMKDIKSPRTIVMTFTNTGDEAVVPPVLTLKTPKTETVATGNQYWWIEPGETLRMTYILDSSVWGGNRTRNLNELTLSYAEGESANLTVSDLYITERPADK